MISLLLSLPLCLTAQDGDLAVLTFDWPSSGSVTVREKIEKRGRTSVSKFDLTWEPDKQGEGSVFWYEDLRMLELDGKSTSSPAMRKAMRMVELMMGAIPKFKVNEAGEWLEVGSFDEMIEAMLGSLQEDSGLDSKEGEKMLTAMKQPVFQQAMETQMAETWGAWVGLWTGLKYERESVQQWDIDMEESWGSVPFLEVTIGARTHYRGVECVEITSKGVADEERALQMMVEMMSEMAESTGQELPSRFPVDRITIVRITHGIYATSDLRPLEVLKSDTRSIWPADSESPQVQFESHHNFFEWDDLEAANPGYQAISE